MDNTEIKDKLFSVARLEGAVQHYAWGGYDFIPRLLNIENRGREPFAELWFGAHPKAPSILHINGATMPLDRFVRRQPTAVLGQATTKRFGDTLPFLLKVLDARDMLSIQVHPSKRQAEEGFAREKALGIPVDAPNRSYKDDNHKPEVHVALTDFWMLHGFRPEAELRRLLHSVPEFAPLAARFEKGVKNLYTHIMTMSQERVDAILEPLIKRLKTTTPRDRDQPDYWAFKASETFPLSGGHRDRGIFSIYLLNLLHLRPGEGTFQDAGVLHAYLHGTNIELMANSDNVIRGGLTPKHVDVDELLKIVNFTCGAPQVLRGEQASPTERIYETPAPDFELTRIVLAQGQKLKWTSRSAEILLLLDGRVDIESQDGVLTLNRGEAVFISANAGFKVTALCESVLYKAGVPL